jgi:hypothetical protein
LNGYADLSVNVINPYVTVAGIEFDIRHSADPTFAGIDTPRIDFYHYRFPLTNPSNVHDTIIYSSGTNRSVPCVVVQWQESVTQVGHSQSTDISSHLATSTDGNVYVLRCHSIFVTDGIVQSDSIDEPLGEVPLGVLTLALKPVGPALPSSWTTPSPCRGGTGLLGGGFTHGYYSASTSPSGVEGCYKMCVPFISFFCGVSYGFAYFNSTVGTIPEAWMYYKPGQGIVDLDGASFVAPANG